MIRRLGKKFCPCLAKNSLSDIARRQGERDLGSYGLARVPIGGARTKADGRPPVDSLGQWATGMHLAGRMDCQSLIGQ